MADRTFVTNPKTGRIQRRERFNVKAEHDQMCNAIPMQPVAGMRGESRWEHDPDGCPVLVTE